MCTIAKFGGQCLSRVMRDQGGLMQNRWSAVAQLWLGFHVFTTDAVEATRACMCAVARKRTSSRSSRYVRLVPEPAVSRCSSGCAQNAPRVEHPRPLLQHVALVLEHSAGEVIRSVIRPINAERTDRASAPDGRSHLRVGTCHNALLRGVRPQARHDGMLQPLRTSP